MTFRKGFFLTCGLLLSYSHAYAKIYKCVDENGKVTFSEIYCPNNQKRKEVEISQQHTKEKKESEEHETETSTSTSENNKSKPIITNTQLMGKWTDYKDKDMRKFRSIWNFTGRNLIMHKYNGQVIKCKYTLKENTLIMHHKNTALGSWDEEVTIKKYSGNTLTWDNLRLYRL